MHPQQISHPQVRTLYWLWGMFWGVCGLITGYTFTDPKSILLASLGWSVAALLFRWLYMTFGSPSNILPGIGAMLRSICIWIVLGTVFGTVYGFFFGVMFGLLYNAYTWTEKLYAIWTMPIFWCRFGLLVGSGTGFYFGIKRFHYNTNSTWQRITFHFLFGKAQEHFLAPFSNVPQAMLLSIIFIGVYYFTADPILRYIGVLLGCIVGIGGGYVTTRLLQNVSNVEDTLLTSIPGSKKLCFYQIWNTANNVIMWCIAGGVMGYFIGSIFYERQFGPVEMDLKVPFFSYVTAYDQNHAAYNRWDWELGQAVTLGLYVGVIGTGIDYGRILVDRIMYIFIFWSKMFSP